MWLQLVSTTLAILKSHSCAIQNIKQSRQARALAPPLVVWQDIVLAPRHPMQLQPAIGSPTAVALAMASVALCTANSRQNPTAPAAATGKN